MKKAQHCIPFLPIASAINMLNSGRNKMAPIEIRELKCLVSKNNRLLDPVFLRPVLQIAIAIGVNILLISHQSLRF